MDSIFCLTCRREFPGMMTMREVVECDECAAERVAEYEAEAEGQAWHDAREGNGYPIGTIGAETR